MEALGRQSRSLSVLLQDGSLPVLAFLPSNDAEYAIASQEAGADAVVMSVGKQDPMFPTLPTGFELSESQIEGTLSELSIPVGISIGDARPLTREIWERIVARPFSFVNMFAHHMPTFVLADQRIEKLVSVGPGYMLEQVRSISDLGQVTAVEAALVATQTKLHSFSLLDLATVNLISKTAAKPVFLRAQKRIGADDFASLKTSGIRGVTLDPSALEPGVEAYRDAIRAYKQWGTRTEQTTQ